MLLSLDILGLSGSGLRKARQCARETGQLDAPAASPLSAKELQASHVPAGYEPNVLEFIICALLISIMVALFKGMSLGNVIEGCGDGLKGVVVASVILMLAITVGAIRRRPVYG